jgi:hypothetical protein
MSVGSTGFEIMEPEGYLQPKRYKFHYRCEVCGHEYSKIAKAQPKHDPKCPDTGCVDKAEIAELKAQMANLQRMLESGVAPAQIGHKVSVKAIDQTASIVMEDFGMTNLRDGIAPGESMAPKLPVAQQTAADNYFSGNGFSPKQIASVTGQPATHGMTAKQTALLGRRAMAGAFRGMAVPPTVVRPKASQGESPLIRVGIEKIR